MTEYMFVKSWSEETVTARISFDEKGRLSLKFRRVSDGYLLKMREIQDINKLMRYASALSRQNQLALNAPADMGEK